MRVWISFRDEWRKTDANGRLDINHSTGPSDQNFGVDVWGKGRAMQRHHWGLDPNKPIPEGETIRLQSGESLGGLVKDETGRPIAAATILLWSHNYKKKDPHELLFDLRAITGARRRAMAHLGNAPRKPLASFLAFRSSTRISSVAATTARRKSFPRSPTCVQKRP